MSSDNDDDVDDNADGDEEERNESVENQLEAGEGGVRAQDADHQPPDPAQ